MRLNIPLPSFCNTPDNFIGGKVAQFVANWQTLTSDNWILQTIQGNIVELQNLEVVGNTPHSLQLPEHDSEMLNAALHEYFHQGIIERTEHKLGSFYSTVFPRPKRDGAVRVIFNLKTFNEKYITHIHFKMDTLRDVLNLIQPECYFASVDFKHAYFSVPIALHLRHMFKFLWKGKVYQFTCLPQGFAPAPRIFTKLLKPVLAHLRSRGVQVICYIDDCLFIAQCPTTLRTALNYAMSLFDSLGLTIHPAKSVFQPTQTIEFLGFQLNSVTRLVSLTVRKQDKISGMAKSLAEKSQITILELASIIGNIVAADPAVPLAPLRYKLLEIERNEQLAIHRGNYDASFKLSNQLKEILMWWAENIHSQAKPIFKPDPDFEIFTDASLLGWGARMGTQTTGGQWADCELAHINILELKAAFLAVQSFCQLSRNIHVKIRSDNTTTVACINKAGSTKRKLQNIIFEFLTWANERNIVLSAAHIPGVENIEADRESRRTNVDAEWMLLPQQFAKICNYYQFQPTIDLFATRLNAQLPKYVSWRPDPSAIEIDAFSLSWSNLTPYCFPPFSVVGQVLQRIRTAKIVSLVILPLWPTKPWFVVALQMLVAPPKLLPRTCLMLPQDPSRQHPLTARLRLTAMLLSGNPTDAMAFLTKCPLSSCIHGGKGHNNNIGITSTNGCHFVSNGRLILFTHM